MEKKIRKPNPEVDNKNWQILFNTQFENLQKKGVISKLWINGLSRLGIDQSKVPDITDLNKALEKYTRWELVDSKSLVFTSAADWNRLTADRKMPVTDFVRTPEELYYCDEPDKWHDVIGHTPYLTDPEYSDMFVNISKLYLEAEKKGKKYMDDVYNMNFALIEVGLIREDGKIKALGTTIYSSAGELESALAEGNSEDFNLDRLLAQGFYDRGEIQKKYFIVDSIAQINDAIEEYRATRLA